MKLYYAMMLCMITSFFCVQDGHAEDYFPTFNLSSMTLYLPTHEIEGYQKDVEHEIGINVAYNITGQLFIEQFQGHIQTIAEGFSGTTDYTTPWKTLTALLAAYQTSDIDKIQGLYAQDAQDIINETFSNPEDRKWYENFMTQITGLEVLVGFEYKTGLLAVVKIYYGDSQSLIMPYSFVHSDSEYLLTSFVLDEAIDTNIPNFLKDHSVADLLNPPVQGHILTVEKDGTGEGGVQGSGIDCGNDCIEVYQEGTVIFLKAISSDDSVFEEWLVDGEPMQGPIEMLKDITVTAIFNQK